MRTREIRRVFAWAEENEGTNVEAHAYLTLCQAIGESIDIHDWEAFTHELFEVRDHVASYLKAEHLDRKPKHA